MRRTLPNKGSEVSKPLQTRLGHFRIKVRKCSVDTSEVLFGGVQRTLPNLYSEVSYATTFLFNPVSCRFHWLISSFSCSQMILHIYLITVCTYFEVGRPWADIIQEINKKSKNSNFLLFTKWLPDLDWLTAWITLGIGLRGHFRIKVRKCPEPLPRAGNSTSNWAVQNAPGDNGLIASKNSPELWILWSEAVPVVVLWSCACNNASLSLDTSDQ